MRNQNYYVAICGPLASGKTSLTRIAAEAYNWHSVYEDLEGHIYFVDYYRDMYKWGFHTAIYFLIRALESQREVKRLLKDKSVCQDWYVREHQGVYNYHMFQEKILTERDYVACSQLDRILIDYSVQPDLIVYLRASRDTLWSRVMRRHRIEEIEGLTKSYLANLMRRYDSWIGTLGDPILQIDTDIYDYVHNEQHRTNILEQIDKLLHQT